MASCAFFNSSVFMTSNQMRYLDFLPTGTQAQFSQTIVTGNQLALLQVGDGLLQVLQLTATNAEQIAQHTVALLLLSHDEWILGIGIEVNTSNLEVRHILSGQNNAHTFVAAYCNQIL